MTRPTLRLGRARRLKADFVNPRCAKCGEKLDGFTAVNDLDATPEAGNVTVCVRCGQLMVFQADKTLAITTPEQLRADGWSDDDLETLRQTIEHIAALRRKLN